MDFKDIPKLVINLEHRKDRREQIKQVLKDYDYEIVDAIKSNCGCNLSHQKCIKIAKERKYPYVCIIEDDFIFLEQKKNKLKIDEYKIPETFDMFFVGGQVIGVIKDEKTSYKIMSARRAECYIVKEDYYDTFLKMLEESWDLTLQNPEIKKYRFDVYWDKLIQKDNWRISNKGIFGGQREGFSDVANKYLKRDNMNYVM